VAFVAVDKPSAGWYKVVTSKADPNGFNDRCPRQMECNVLLDVGDVLHART
jgi:hypothetical protein